MNLGKFQELSVCALCALSLAASPALDVSAIDTIVEKRSGNIYGTWPDLRDFSSGDAASAAASVEDDSLFAHILSPEELAGAFGSLPPLLYTGSFFLNELNSIPDFVPDSDYEIHSVHGRLIMRRPWASLQQEITERLASYQGDWAVYLKDLSVGRTMEINEHSMESASLIKLYIAGAIYEQLELGNLEESDTVMSALNAMITVSDNESSNVLVRQICDESGDFQTGLAKVNDFIERYGFSSTQQVNGIADPSLWVSDGRVNMTSAADCGRLLEMVYNGELVSHFNSFRFEVLLNKQEVNYKIPAGLPEGVHISHKTGEVDDTENDAAIIYTPYGDYIFCIMSTDLTDTGSAVDHIHEITKLIYDYFRGYELYTDKYMIVEAAPENKYYIVETSSSGEELFEHELIVPMAIHEDSGEIEWCIADDSFKIQLAVSDASGEAETDME